MWLSMLAVTVQSNGRTLTGNETETHSLSSYF